MQATSEVTSLSDIVLHHRELLVNPLFWTSRHLDALGCRFRHIDNATTKETCDGHRASQRTNDNHTSSGKKRMRMSDAEMLATSAVPSVKYHILCRFLLHEGSVFNKRTKGPHFFFAGRPVHRPQYTVFYRRHQHSPSGQDFQPLLGYLDYLDVTSFRVRNRGYSTESTHSFAKGSSHIAPNEWTDDPYFMCVLLSIAQLQERLARNSSPTSHTSRLLVVNRDDHDFIYLYEGQFTSQFLTMLDRPLTATSCPKVSAIHRRKIPFKPFEDLQERI
ncbi:hypothetical protein ARAM_000778 [Aspergillus rambellii]|uniref:Uncharacterized protein n=1 Tax=Aspergillus rambellii TaxID=308745 RepID=A0A0F8UU52_9EURO|nr:hypothetical protein ARAM_000778 [Aspergillus rambellii]